MVRYMTYPQPGKSKSPLPSSLMLAGGCGRCAGKGQTRTWTPKAIKKNLGFYYGLVV